MNTKNLELSSKKTYLLFSVCFITFGIAVAILASLFNYRLQATSINEEVLKRAQAEEYSKLALLGNSIALPEQVTKALVQNSLLLTYIEKPSSASLFNIQNIIYLYGYEPPTVHAGSLP